MSEWSFGNDVRTGPASHEPGYYKARGSPLAHARSYTSSCTAFTLVELILVITILGLLAGILIPTVASVQTAARRTQTKTQFAQWGAAMELFRQEYGYYPAIATEGKIDPAKFAPALLGRRNLAGDAIDLAAPATAWCGNVRQLVLYHLSPADLGPDGATLVDAFGNADIAVRVDLNGDGRIDASDTGAGYSAGWPAVAGAKGPLSPSVGGALAARVVFYSAGKGEADVDLVLSWQ